ncbi:hypothetical protein EGR_05422 [Echinococcus granulosus]|uniref:Uncharacterized protein n=1 Tax=Echinococcus granulosus TaxID=6210 RepID=U6JD50_ECHGR|nr:hypothetical protein EGR_05422 [Echinococcus granulosus]EUB59660.1 hypothetical protein EGR_05422 [Echinococcus granulosus]CDS21960.1 hypothetical protein EgrG_002023500 [Echinococcus granulosus]
MFVKLSTHELGAVNVKVARPKSKPGGCSSHWEVRRRQYYRLVEDDVVDSVDKPHALSNAKSVFLNLMTDFERPRRAECGELIATWSQQRLTDCVSVTVLTMVVSWRSNPTAQQSSL